MVSSPPLRHRVPGVHGKIHHDLLDLARIELHRLRPGRRRVVRLNVLADYSSQHTSGCRPRRFRSRRFGSRTCWRLNARSWRVRKPRAPRRGRSHLTISRFASSDGNCASNICGVTGNHGQQVIEVVGHAARQLTERLHFLRLVKLRLQPLSFGNVAHDAHEDSVGCRAGTRSPRDPPESVEPSLRKPRQFPADADDFRVSGAQVIVGCNAV